MAKTRRKSTKGKRCCVTDTSGRKIACFSGPGASERAAALQQIVKRSKTSSSCSLPRRR